MSAVTLRKLLPRAPTSRSLRAGVRLAALFRRRDLHAAGEIGAGERVRVGQDVGRGSLRDDLAAVDAGAGADIDDIIGGEDGVFVVLDHDDRIAEVAQPTQGFQQPGVVALVQPDGGLVQHIEHAGEAGADLRGQPDALAFAARQAARAARQSEIIEPDVDQEPQPLIDLAQDARGDFLPLGVEFFRQGLEPGRRLADRKLGNLADMPMVDLDRQSLGLEAESRCRRRRASPPCSARFPRAPIRFPSRDSAARDCG